ncbi:SIS domain-containing protein [Niallia taxi]|uniref:SIS domain-containing protein n=1 Tax=Niallia taxi TaxID=2499688 RepID=UPI002E21AECC|nr:SIS domain-containing protein [Niallia taxi]
MLEMYFDKATEKIELVRKNEMKQMKEAANRIAVAIQNEGIIQLFGCGHSHILTEEVCYRAGGLVPINPILYGPLMLHEGALRSSELERQNGLAEKFMSEQDIRQEDVMVVISTSGRNPVPVDVAQIAKDKGAFVIGITSMEYSKSQPSRHISGKHLYNSVDLVIDNFATKGDAALTYNKVNVPFGPTSTVVGAVIINAILAESVKILADKGIEPPVFLSGNMDGADEHNSKLVEKYKKRIRLLN